MSYDLPITISAGDFTDPSTGVGTTPLAKIAVRFSEAIINTTWDKAQASSAAASASATNVANGIDAIIASPGSYHVTPGAVAVPTVTAPSVIIPSTIDTSTILATFDTEYPQIAAFLKTQADYIVNTYFPDDSALYGAAETWLADAIANGGIPASTQAQVWGDDFARITADKQRAVEAIPAYWAGRRFPLPPDVAASQIMQIEQKAQDELAESSRKIAILNIENMKWAIDRVKDMRQIMLSAMVSYVQAMGKSTDAAAAVTGLGYGEQSKLISAAAGFYSADTNAKEMMSKVAQYNNSTAFEGAVKNQMADLQLMRDKVEALLKDLQFKMSEATALWNNLHASAGTSVSV